MIQGRIQRANLRLQAKPPLSHSRFTNIHALLSPNALFKIAPLLLMLRIQFEMTWQLKLSAEKRVETDDTLKTLIEIF